MAYNINITNGSGTSRIPNGNYSVTTNVTGYDNTSILPSNVTIVDGTNEYLFTVSATGTLTLHVSETGASDGTAVVGAKFKRCDSTGAIYGSEITTNDSGNAIFNNVPFATTGAPLIYYKQIASDSIHEFDDTLKNISMTTETQTVEITNTLAAERTIKYTDANYDNLPIDTAEVVLN